MHGDHSRKEPFYQQVRKFHSLYTTPQNYSSTQLQATILHYETSIENPNLKIYKLHHSTHHSIRNLQQKQQRISTASTAKKENLQQRKLQHLKIYRSTNSPLHGTTALENLQQTSREFLQQKGIYVTRTKYKENNLQHLRQITQGPNKGLHKRGHIPKRI